MKRKHLLTACGIALALVLLFAGKIFAGEKPFRGIQAADIESVTVELIPPQIEFTLNEEEIGEFAGLLRQAVVYQQDHESYEGQAVCFTIVKTDGTEILVNAYNPVLMINGVSYKTKYEPCEALSSFANRLRREREGL